jgi:hypothetical protein
VLSQGLAGETHATSYRTARVFGIPDWVLSYRKDWLRPDIIAGLTAAAVVIPKSMAYTSIAGLPLQVGRSAHLRLPGMKESSGNARIIRVEIQLHP